MKANNTYIPRQAISQYVDDMKSRYETQRRPFERRWYDNNLFDDGFHFHYVSRETGKIVDNSRAAQLTGPKRAIPKSSRQIRGVVSLLLQLNPRPAIYPERVPVMPMIEELDPQTQQLVKKINPKYEEARQKTIDQAKKIGFWVDSEWDNQDLDEKMTHLLILAAKHGVSFLQVWPDAITEKIETQVFDAFDIYLDGTLTSIYDSPSITKSTKTFINEIKANETFDEEQRMLITPDNKYASSEVKEAYMRSRFGSGQETETQSSLILNETFIKEYISKENIGDIKERQNGEVLDGKSYGDIVLRHVFSTSNGWLLDEYTTLPEYPFVDCRYEPGLIYQVPLIERFIPANKSVDIAVSRIEGYANTMVTGVYQKRKGENFKISNIPGGQIIEYDQMPLTQMQPSSVPGFMFNFINLLESYIEEQGASTSTLNKLPSGVKSGIAIESVKASEYANLKIPTQQFEKMVKRITQRLLDLGADLIIDPKEVAKDIDGVPTYFDIIGQKGMEIRNKYGIETPEDWVVIKKNPIVKIEVENGLGYTTQGKKDSMQQIANYMLQMVQAGMVSKEQVQILVKRFLEVFQFGSTAEFMQAAENGQVDMTEQTVQQIKIAVLETLKDAGVVGEKADQKLVDSTKIGVIEAMRDTGTLKKEEPKTTPNKVSINYKDLTPSGKVQAAAMAGIEEVPAGVISQEVQSAT